jgi:hypothetical protein
MDALAEGRRRPRLQDFVRIGDLHAAYIGRVLASAAN